MIQCTKILYDIDLLTENSLAPLQAGFLLNQCYNYFIGTYPISEEQLKAFLEKVKADTSLREKLKGAADADTVLAIAKEAGLMSSADDLKSAQSELSEEELEGVAGGRQSVLVRRLRRMGWICM